MSLKSLDIYEVFFVAYEVFWHLWRQTFFNNYDIFSSLTSFYVYGVIWRLLSSLTSFVIYDVLWCLWHLYICRLWCLLTCMTSFYVHMTFLHLWGLLSSITTSVIIIRRLASLTSFDVFNIFLSFNVYEVSFDIKRLL